MTNENKRSEAQQYLASGNAKYQKGQHSEAIADYDKAIALDPNDAEAYNNRGTAKRDLKQYDAAIADYNKAIALNSTISQPHYGLGLVYRAQGDESKAKEFFRQAAEIDPTFISKEQLKELEGKIEAQEERVEQTESFQQTLSDLQDTYRQTRTWWFWAAVIMLILFVGVFVLTAWMHDAAKWIDLVSRISLNLLFATLAFVAVRQYLKVNALVLEAANRLAMAKLLARMQSHENNQEIKDYAMPKLIDSICYRLNSKPAALDVGELVKHIKKTD